MESDNQIKTTVSVSSLKTGDTVEIDGKLETVSKHHLKKGFTGDTYKGSPYRNGIIKIVFKVPIREGFRYQ